MGDYTFKKYERLSSKKEIDSLFLMGYYFHCEGLTIKWMHFEFEGNTSAKILISVPKRKFKLAVDRNKIKRQIREGYRKNKNILLEELNKSNKKIIFAVIYGNKEIISTQEVEERIIVSLNRLNKEMEINNNIQAND